MTEATPRPWHLSDHWEPPNGGFTIHGPENDDYVADVYAAHHPDDKETDEVGTANAKLIVRAVNAHATMLAALQRAQAIELSVTQGLERELREGYRELLTAAIAAGGESQTVERRAS